MCFLKVTNIGLRMSVQGKGVVLSLCVMLDTVVPNAHLEVS